MENLITLTGKCLTREIKNVIAMFNGGSKDSHVIDLKARELNAQRRERKFSFADYLCSAIEFVSVRAGHQTTYHLEGNREQYQEEFGREISNKCFHKQVSKDESLELVTEMGNQVLSALNRKLAGSRDRLISSDMKQILKKIGVKDIVAVDGCEIQLREGCRQNFPCKASGRNKENGAPAAPGVKIHAVFSVVEQSLKQMAISEGVADERQRTFAEEHRGDCVICDRGYIDGRLERQLTGCGAEFIIKGRRNMVSGTVVEACGDNGEALPELIGMRYGDARELDDKTFDVVVEDKDGYRVRITRMLNPSPDSGRTPDGNNEKPDDRYVYLRTSIGRDRLSPEQLFQTYRMRWMVEHLFECLQQGCATQSINSANKNVVLSYLIINVIAAMLKCYLTVTALLRYKLSFLDLSMIKVNIKPHVTEVFFRALGRLCKSQMYEAVQRSAEVLFRYCTVSHVSARDQARLKSYRYINSFIQNGFALNP